MEALTRFFEIYGDMFSKAIVTHLFYVTVSVSVGFVLGLLFGILLSRVPQLSAITLPLISVFQTIPGIVFIGVLFLYTGMKPITVLIALSIYAMFPVLKNTYTGLTGVEKQYLEAAWGCGMTPLQTLLQVELPLAMPNIIGGLRLSTVYTVSWATLAAIIGLGGLGDFIYQGVSSNNNTLIIAGAIPAACMAIILGKLIDRLQVAVPPRGMRKGGSK